MIWNSFFSGFLAVNLNLKCVSVGSSWGRSPLYLEWRQALNDERKHLNKVLIEHKKQHKYCIWTHNTHLRLSLPWHTLDGDQQISAKYVCYINCLTEYWTERPNC